jgi:hypothetical protein
MHEQRARGTKESESGEGDQQFRPRRLRLRPRLGRGIVLRVPGIGPNHFLVGTADLQFDPEHESDDTDQGEDGKHQHCPAACAERQALSRLAAYSRIRVSKWHENAYGRFL